MKKNISFYKKQFKIFRHDLIAEKIGIHPSFFSRLLAGKHIFTDVMRQKFDLFLKNHKIN